MRPVVYLDNAATTFPKPPAVLREVNTCLSSYCGNPGRGTHSLAMASAQKIYDCRECLSDFIGLDAPENIIFTLNTTYALNFLIKGLLQKGDHVLISDLEHNSVLRPIWKLASEGVIEYDIFPSYCLDPRCNPTRICAGIATRMKRNTKLVLCTHASNICSYRFPLKEMGEFCHRHGVLFAVDAAQSAGHIPISMKEMQIDALCAPGHKGLYGTQGGGFLALNDMTLDTLMEGGNGVHSLDMVMPEEGPERFEVGTMCIPAIAALLKGVEQLGGIGADQIKAHEEALFSRLCNALTSADGFTVYAPEHRGGVLLFNMNGVPSETVAAALGERDICVRGGFHCSPLGHRTLGTGENGAVRASFGIFNTAWDIDYLINTLLELKSEFL